MLIGSIKKLSKDSIIYGFSGAIHQLVGLILLPILTRVFSPTDYGVIDIITTFSSITLIFLLLGVNSATQRYYFDADDQSEKEKVVSTAFWFVILYTSFSSAILYSIVSPLSQLLFGNLEHVFLLKWAIIAFPFTALMVFGKDNLRLLFKPWKYNIVTITYTLLRVLIVIYLVIIFGRGLIGNFEGAFAASIITALLAVYYSRSIIKAKFSYSILKKLLKYGIPLAFAGLAYWVINFSDRLILLKLSTLDQVGLYSVGNRISSVLVLVTSAFSLAWSPFIFSVHNIEETKKVIIKTYSYLTLLLLTFSLILSLFAKEFLIIITTRDYIGASSVVGILTVGLSFLGISSILATGLTLVKKTRYITISSVLAAALNIALNILLIPKLGMIGAAIATLISYITLCVIYYYYSQKYYPLSFELSKIFKTFLLFAVFIFIASVISIDNVVIAALIKIVLFIFSIILLYYTRIVSKQELRFISIIGKQLFTIIKNKTGFTKKKNE